MVFRKDFTTFGVHKTIRYRDMPKEKSIGFEALGGLVFSTDRNIDLSPQKPEEETPAPAVQNLRVRRDTSGRKGKVVTLVDGFLGREQDLESLAKDVKKHCGAGGSAKDGQIIIQGDVSAKVKAFLVSKGFLKTR